MSPNLDPKDREFLLWKEIGRGRGREERLVRLSPNLE
jgi:hypothetical protein